MDTNIVERERCERERKEFTEDNVSRSIKYYKSHSQEEKKPALYHIPAVSYRSHLIHYYLSTTYKFQDTEDSWRSNDPFTHYINYCPHNMVNNVEYNINHWNKPCLCSVF